MTGSAGNDTLTGNAGNDRFNVDLGTDTITDLGGTGGSESDILVVSAGATANATDINSFTATSDTRNDGTANLTARSAGGTIDLTYSAAGGYTITGGAGTDTLTGGSGNDIIAIAAAGEGDTDTIKAGSGTNTLL